MIRVQDATPYSLVVGVDGSEASIDALCWAAAEARLLNTQVIAVHAWQPSEALRAPYASMSGVPTPQEDRDHAASILKNAVSQLLDADPRAPVISVLDEGAPAAVLLRHAREALLLALGRGQRNDARTSGLGPVARECVRHAPCPVVTVPAAQSARPDRPFTADQVKAVAFS
ncbi:universal stress protein [Streptomyces sp. NPDC007172]|uniref:universal stress protein n=1 Tax=Streptomyces sp. NPDC007172 TaxID=3364776 RepID=UPI003688FCF5